MIVDKYFSDHILSHLKLIVTLALFIYMGTVVIRHKGISLIISRMEYLSELIKNNISLCTFDFSGCGNS